MEKTVEFVKALALKEFEALHNCRNLDLKHDGLGSLMDPMSLADYKPLLDSFEKAEVVKLECSAEPL